MGRFATLYCSRGTSTRAWGLMLTASGSPRWAILNHTVDLVSTLEVYAQTNAMHHGTAPNKKIKKTKITDRIFSAPIASALRCPLQLATIAGRNATTRMPINKPLLCSMFVLDCVRFLVAAAPRQDLFFFAQHLFVAASGDQK